MFSFKINKKSGSVATPVQLKSSPQVGKSRSAFNDEDDAEEEPDFIDGLDGNKIVSKKKEKKVVKEELVIPLISKNEWRIDKSTKEKPVEDISNDGPNSTYEPGGNTSANSNEDALKQQAIKELLQGASSKDSEKNSNRSIPILFQNRVPEGFEEEDNMDVSLRPDQSTLEDYERIPIEDFGLAMLRGMGWKETEGIGLKNKKVVNMTEPKLRPKGMGLGAEAAHLLRKDVAPANSAQNNDEKEDLSFKIGGYAVITRGSKKGYYGQIESFDEDNNRVIIRLAISGKMEAVSKFYINVVSAKEYKKSSKVINREKYEEFKTKQENKEKDNNERDDADDRKSSNSRKHKDIDSRNRSRKQESDEEVEPKSRSRRHESDEEEDTRTRSRKYESDEEIEPRSRSRRNASDDDGDSRTRSRNRDRDRSRDRHEDNKYEKHSSRRSNDRRYDDSRRHRNDDYDDYYESSSKSDRRDKRSDHRSSKKSDRYDRDRR